MKRERLLAAVLLVVTATALSGQTRPKRFLTAPLTVEDQGSFFVGGVQKVTDYASVAPPVSGPARRSGGSTRGCLRTAIRWPLEIREADTEPNI